MDVGLFGVIVLEIGYIFYTNWRSEKERTRLLDEVSKCTKAVMSRNINEYIAAVSADKPIQREEPLPESETVNLGDLGQDEWEKAMGIVRTPPDKS